MSLFHLKVNRITCSQADIVIPVREPNEKLDAISQILKTLKKGDKVLIYAELKSQVMICDLEFSSDKYFIIKNPDQKIQTYTDFLSNISTYYTSYNQILNADWWVRLNNEEADLSLIHI